MSAVQEHFKMGYSKVVSAPDGELMYCDFLTSADPTIYEEVTSLDKVTALTNDSLGACNALIAPRLRPDGALIAP